MVEVSSAEETKIKCVGGETRWKNQEKQDLRLLKHNPYTRSA